MTVETPAADAANLPEHTHTAPPANAQTPISDMPDDIQTYIKSLREEAKAAKAELRAAKAASEAANLKTVEDLQAALTTRSTELEAAQARIDAVNADIKASNEQLIAKIPENMRGLVPAYDDPAKLRGWLDANANLLQRQTLPNTGAGETGPSPDRSKQLTAEQEEAARALGVDTKTVLKHL